MASFEHLPCYSDPDITLDSLPADPLAPLLLTNNLALYPSETFLTFDPSVQLLFIYLFIYCFVFLGSSNNHSNSDNKSMDVAK